MTDLKANRDTVLFDDHSIDSNAMTSVSKGLAVTPLTPAQTAEAEGRSWIKVKFTPVGEPSRTGWVIKPHFDDFVAPSPKLQIDGFIRTCFLATAEFNESASTAPWFVSPNFIIARAVFETGVTNAGAIAAPDAAGPLQVTPAEWSEFRKNGGDFAKDFEDDGFDDPMLQIYAAVYRMFADAKAITEAGVQKGKGPDPKGNPFLPTYLDLLHAYLLGSPAAALALIDAQESAADKDKKMDVLLKDSLKSEQLDSVFKTREKLLGTKEAAKTVAEFVTATEAALTGALKQAADLIKQHAPEELPREEGPPGMTLSAGIPTNVASTFGGVQVPFGVLASPPLSDRFWPVITGEPEAMVISYRTTAGEIVGHGGRCFFADRRNGQRHHVGMDIFCKRGDVVVACAPGKIVKFFHFYKTSTGEDSFALFVEHDGVVVNYGEVRKDANTEFKWSIDDSVTAGQPIARVSSTDMIHFETYAPGTRQNARWLRNEPLPAKLQNPTMLLLTLASGAKRIGANGTTSVNNGSAVPKTSSGAPMTDEDLLTMARTIYGEARNQPVAGREAVGHVIMNRVRRNKALYGGNHIAAVCRKDKQFSCWNLNDPNRALIINMLPGANPEFNACLQTADQVIKGQLPDNTGDATHYLNPKTVGHMPSWATPQRQTVKIGAHQFYTHVDD